MIKYLIISLLTIFFLSCEEDAPVQKALNLSEKGVFIINEGNFTRGNASLSFLGQDNRLTNQIFETANSRILGDVAQSMTIWNGLGFVVVNNSGKVEVIDTKTVKTIITITGFVSPRYLLAINSQKAYVSDLNSESIKIVDFQSKQITGEIAIGHSSEKMLLHGKQVFVLNWSQGNTIQVIDNETDRLISTLQLSMQPNSLVLDKNNKLWVLCDGGFAGMSGNEKAALYRINPENLSVEARFEFSNMQHSPNQLCTNAAKDKLFYLNEGVFQMSIQDTQLPDIPIVSAENKLFYGMAVEPATSTIYASDAIDYQQSGYVFRYQTDGVKIDSFLVDIIPGSFCFKN